MIFLNFKTYESGTGDNAVTMSKVVEEVSKEFGIKIVVVAQPTDIKEINRGSAVEVWAQKVDPISFGAHTGGILPESVVDDGAVGTVLNHSENRFNDFESLSLAHKRAKEVGLKTLIFTKDLEELQKAAELKPDFISYEPPSLIGSKDISVATAEPEVISKAVIISKNFGIPLIVGAGVHSKEDVKKCIELGSSGIAVASDVMLSDNPKEELSDLIEGFK